MPTGSDLLRQSSFTCSHPGEVPVGAVRAALTQSPVVRIRGLFDPAAIASARARVAERFRVANDRKHDPRDTEAVRTNLQKLVVGGTTGIDAHRSLARFLRMFYNPIFRDDVYGMRAHFVTLATLRNRLYGLRGDFAVHGTEDGLWTASRIHQYPRGGGFMVGHRDAYSRAAVAGHTTSFVQVFLLMSRQGEDWMEGGAFVDHQGERVHYEDQCAIGDVIVYDGSAVHGVGDIDPLAPLDLTCLSGRVVAFASLYRHLAPGASDYARLALGASLRGEGR